MIAVSEPAVIDEPSATQLLVVTMDPLLPGLTGTTAGSELDRIPATEAGCRGEGLFLAAPPAGFKYTSRRLPTVFQLYP